MTLAEILLSIALSLPTPWYPPGRNPETADEYRTRMEAISQAIALEADAAEGWRWDTTSLAAATLVTWYAESRFALEVHNGSGSSRFGEDQGRARCFGQLHATGLVPRSEWRQLTGVDLDATRRCARATMRVLTSTANRCGMKESKPNNVWTVAKMIAAYMSGKGCEPTKASQSRARRWSKVMEQIKSAAAAEPILIAGQQG